MIIPMTAILWLLLGLIDWLSKSELQILCIIKNYYLSTRWIVYFKFVNSVPLKIHTFTYYRYARMMRTVQMHFRILFDHIIFYEYCSVLLTRQYRHRCSVCTNMYRLYLSLSVYLFKSIKTFFYERIRSVIFSLKWQL